MPLIPLEDSYVDILNKAQAGRKVTDERLASVSGVSMEDFAALKAGTLSVAVLRRVARHLRLNPDALEAIARQKYYPKIPLISRGFAMFNQPFGETSVNSYLIWDTRSKVAAAFDTGVNATDMIDFIKAEDLRLQYILISHTHADHVGGLEALQAATKAQAWCHEAETLPNPAVRQFKEGAYFHVAEISIKALLTNGHSAGLTSFFVKGLSLPIAFVGDSLFAGSMGGSPEHLDMQRRNNHHKLFTLPKDSVFAPGHGPLTTLQQERAANPFVA